MTDDNQVILDRAADSCRSLDDIRYRLYTIQKQLAQARTSQAHTEHQRDTFSKANKDKTLTSLLHEAYTLQFQIATLLASTEEPIPERQRRRPKQTQNNISSDTTTTKPATMSLTTTDSDQNNHESSRNNNNSNDVKEAELSTSHQAPGTIGNQIDSITEQASAGSLSESNVLPQPPLPPQQQQQGSASTIVNLEQDQEDVTMYSQPSLADTLVDDPSFTGPGSF